MKLQNDRFQPRFSDQDHHHLAATEAWLELGNHREAQKELRHITRQNRFTVPVLKLRWRIAAAEKDWQKCARLANRIALKDPCNPWGHLYLALALDQLGFVADAHEGLTFVSHVWEEHPVVHYFLAYYSAKLGRLDEAHRHLDKALALCPGDTPLAEVLLDSIP
jgi:tetratricopeptide (TPR) repeat protein